MGTTKKTLLFNASCVALVVTALTFATRGSFVESWANEFNLTHTQVGWIVGTAFWGFTLAMVFGGPLVDIIGGLVVFLFNNIGLTNWRWAMGMMLIPTLLYGYMFLNQKFPQTERVVSGFSYQDMLKACVSPLFLFMAFCMILTAATELGTNQWIAALLSNVSDNPILLLVWISGIMALARQFGGTIVHNVRSTIILLLSSVLAFAGLIMMGYTNGVMVFVSAGVFALGIAFFWPTMLGFVSENIRESGALGLAIMGGIGFLGGAIAQPVLGAIFDAQTLAQIPADYAIDTLKSALAGTQEAAVYAKAQLAGGAMTLRYVTIVPAALIIFFSFLHFRKRKNV